ncbi:MAG: hypothetical protein QNM02_13845 [Acidimicrobiia bacterium]|nr:hypothetical protein [Acidimicrobiia bacterium]
MSTDDLAAEIGLGLGVDPSNADPRGLDRAVDAVGQILFADWPPVPDG